MIRRKNEVKRGKENFIPRKIFTKRSGVAENNVLLIRETLRKMGQAGATVANVAQNKEFKTQQVSWLSRHLEGKETLNERVTREENETKKYKYQEETRGIRKETRWEGQKEAQECQTTDPPCSGTDPLLNWMAIV